MIERLIENWLSQTNERGHEAAFCQLLVAEGHRIVHLDRHTGTEHGKDIITFDNTDQLCAFQLKSGNIDVGKWRKEVEPEIIELVEYPVQHPNATGLARPHLVTTGRINENTNGRIMARNKGFVDRGYQPLEVIQGTDLLARFIRCHGQFLPRDVEDFELLLKAFLADGKDLINKVDLSRLLLHLLPDTLSRRTHIVRAIASSLILTSYALSPFQRDKNFFALFEGWTIAAAHVARIAELKRIPKKMWSGSFELAMSEAWQALVSACKEAVGRTSLVEGNILTETGPVYHARLTILCGLVATYLLLRETQHDNQVSAEECREFIKNHRDHAAFWGESALPYFLVLAWQEERQGKPLLAEKRIAELVHVIAWGNSSRRQPNNVPSPYHGVDSCLAAMCGIAPQSTVRDTPGVSYSVDSLIGWLARRNRKQLLSSLWYNVTDIQLAEMQFKRKSDFYMWRSCDSELCLHFVARPTEWARLRQSAQSLDFSKLPKSIREDHAFAMLFLLVYPHRLCPDLVGGLDHALFEELC